MVESAKPGWRTTMSGSRVRTSRFRRAAPRPWCLRAGPFSPRNAHRRRSAPRGGLEARGLWPGPAPRSRPIVTEAQDAHGRRIHRIRRRRAGAPGQRGQRQEEVQHRLGWYATPYPCPAVPSVPNMRRPWGVGAMPRGPIATGAPPWRAICPPAAMLAACAGLAPASGVYEAIDLNGRATAGSSPSRGC